MPDTRRQPAERGLLLSADLVVETREERKTMTRRLMVPQPSAYWTPASYGDVHKLVDGSPDPGRVIGWGPCNDDGLEAYRSPYGQPGDRLYVREAAWMWCERVPNGLTPAGNPKWLYRAMTGAPVHYLADGAEKPTTPLVSPDTGNEWMWRYKAARFLPRWASRLELEITSVRVERLHDITEADAQAEGVEATSILSGHGRQYVWAFEELWDEINGHRAGASWRHNPWVWVIGYRLLSVSGRQLEVQS